MAALLFKIAVAVLVVLILLSLGSGMFFLVKDQGQSPRMRNALTVRIGLSIALFALLLIGYKAGWIKPHGLLPDEGTPNEARPLPTDATGASQHR